MNKKLIKTIASITCGLGIVGSIPFITTSCGNSSEEKIYALPEDVYQIDANGVLRGFKSGVDLAQYNDGKCDTLLIPASVTSIAASAFYNDPSTIPTFITKLVFAKGSQCTSIGSSAFCYWNSLTSINLLKCNYLDAIDAYVFSNCSALTSVIFPKSLTKLGGAGTGYVFESCPKLNDIKWNLPNEYKTKINISDGTFNGISSEGQVESLNKKIASSQELLNWIKNKGNFPTGDGWTAA